MIDKAFTCEYCNNRGPMLNGGGFICKHTKTRLTNKHGHCEYHTALKDVDLTLNLEVDDASQQTLFD